MQRNLIRAAAISGVALAAIGFAAAKNASSVPVSKSLAIVVVPAPTPTPTPTPTPSPTPTPVPTPTPKPTPTPTTTLTVTSAVQVKKLAPLYLADMKLWNWGGTWIGSEWSNALSPIGWKYNHIVQDSIGDTRFRLDTLGAPELQAGGATPAYARGLWEAEVTVPKLRDGLITAPLWLYDSASRDEIDFEFAGRKGLDVTIHGLQNGVMKTVTTRLFAGKDMSGQRHRFGIKVDEAAGYVEMYVDGVRVQRWDRAAVPFLPTHALKPWISMWAASPTNTGFVSWAGQWLGILPTDSVVMTVHGYGYSAI